MAGKGSEIAQGPASSVVPWCRGAVMPGSCSPSLLASHPWQIL